ncbi:MAG: haloalkane dehalogenase [Myxococcales bacterium]|nr:haloalkane dehalogenase [Myxococcales bacterium]
MHALRTPDDRFAGLLDYPFAPHYAEVDGLRMHYVDEGKGGANVVLLHGEPSWSYLYRHFVPAIAAAGHRVIAPDLIGFGRSDKPTDPAAYSYASHLEWLRGLLFDRLGLQDIVLFCQDWGGLLGLRLVGEHPDRFRAVLAANTFLPSGNVRMPPAFHQWRAFVERTPDLPVGFILQGATKRELTAAEIAAYEAPFPDAKYKVGAQRFPLLVPVDADDPAIEGNIKAWVGLAAFPRPFLTVFSDGDPITRGADAVLQKKIAGAAGQPHGTVPGGHFLQEDSAPALVDALLKLIERA